jgi:diamine N-acetyltransferase
MDQRPTTNVTSNRIPILRRATVDDATALAHIARTTFVETFGHLYPPEDLQAYLAKACAVEHCREKLTDRSIAVWFAVVGADEPAGFIIAGRCKLPVQNLEYTAGEVQQLYIRSKYQNLRIGTLLMNTALGWLESKGYAPLYVGVWSGDFGAQRFYARYGFSKIGEYGFPVGNTIDREFILTR